MTLLKFFMIWQRRFVKAKPHNLNSQCILSEVFSYLLMESKISCLHCSGRYQPNREHSRCKVNSHILFMLVSLCITMSIYLYSTNNKYCFREFSITSMTGGYRRVFQKPIDFEWYLKPPRALRSKFLWKQRLILG